MLQKTFYANPNLDLRQSPLKQTNRLPLISGLKTINSSEAFAVRSIKIEGEAFTKN
jgi:hypothetical protein